MIAISKIRGTQNARARDAATRVVALIAIQLAAGFLNLGLLAPLWIQLIHLFIADIVWIVTLIWALEDAAANASFEAPLKPAHGFR